MKKTSFDEPTIGLHPQDVIKNADYLIDMGPGGGKAGVRS
jgi:excinuclease UvrABC ATPase subunit